MYIYGYGLHVGCGLAAVKDLYSWADVHECKSCGLKEKKNVGGGGGGGGV